MAFPTPVQLGLPQQYSTWRPHQVAALQDCHASLKRFKVVSMSGGAGKTLLYMGKSRLRPKQRHVIVTANKGLQDQAVGVFGSYGLHDLRGKNNYECEGRPGNTCEDGAIAKCPYRGSGACPHFAAKHEFAETQVGITNFSCWIAGNKYGMGFGTVDSLIFDEAHGIPSEVEKAMHITLGEKEICERLERDWPDHRSTGDMEAWKHWARVTGILVETNLQRIEKEVKRSAHPSPAAIGDFRALRNLSRKLADLSTCKPERWVPDENEYGYCFDPTDASEYAERIMWCGVEDIMLASGTMTPRTLKMCGLGKTEYDFFEYETAFKGDTCPMVWVPTMRLSRSTTPAELRKYLIPRIDEIIEERLDRKGIIHTSNFQLRDFIYAHSRYRSIMHSNWKKQGDITSEVVERFKQAKSPAILISPSVTTGYDFPFDACRWQAVAKLPLPNTFSSKIEQERAKTDKVRGIHTCWNSLAQAYKRGDRDDDDRQEFFILDDNIEWLMDRYVHLAAAWVPAYFTTSSVVPDVMELEAA